MKNKAKDNEKGLLKVLVVSEAIAIFFLLVLGAVGWAGTIHSEHELYCAHMDGRIASARFFIVNLNRLPDYYELEQVQIEHEAECHRK